MAQFRHIAAVGKVARTLAICVMHNVSLRVVVRPCRHTRAVCYCRFAGAIDYYFAWVQQSSVDVFHRYAYNNVADRFRIGSQCVVQQSDAVFAQDVIECQ